VRLRRQLLHVLHVYHDDVFWELGALLVVAVGTLVGVADVVELETHYLLAQRVALHRDYARGRVPRILFRRLQHLHPEFCLVGRSCLVLRVLHVGLEDRLKLLPDLSYFLGLGGLLDLECVQLVVLNQVVEAVLDEDDPFKEGFDVELLQDLGTAHLCVFDGHRPLHRHPHLLY